jgi:hypothetical protein
MADATLLDEIGRMPTADVYKIELYARQIRLSRSGAFDGKSLSPDRGSRIRSRRRFRIDEDSAELIKRFRD